MTQRRPRGRPASGGGDTKAAILTAAREQFATRGFAGSSLREIARRAGVDPSLISHYFGGKDQLLVATLQLPVNPMEKIAEVLGGDTAGMAVRLLRTFLTSWDPHREVFSAVMRTGLGGGDTEVPMQHLARELVVTAIRDRLDGDDRDVRAGLIASQLIGMAIMRYVVQIESLATAPVDEIIRLYAPSIQRLMDGDEVSQEAARNRRG